MELAVIGNSEFIVGFRLAGIRKVYAAEGDEELVETVTRVLDDPEVAILVMEGSDMVRLPPRLQTTLENSIRPTLISIGEEEGGMPIRERIKRSVGVDLWK
ncbi:MAG: V-type ATP synthase subunit F [Methanomicrobiales archaeon]